MKSAHEILAHETALRAQRENGEQAWTLLSAAFRGSRWLGLGPIWMQPLIFVLLLPLILNIGEPDDFRALHYFAIWSLLLTVIQTYATQRRREKALRRIIEQEAPELHQKLAEKLKAEM